MDELKLSDARVGGEYVVVRIEGPPPVKRKIMDLGLLPGTRIKVVAVAPLGDPIDLEFRGFNVSIRRSEARNIIVREVRAP